MSIATPSAPEVSAALPVADFERAVEKASRAFAGHARFAWKYSRAKLRHDPVYRQLAERAPFQEPVVDLGCGRGQTELLFAVLIEEEDARQVRSRRPEQLQPVRLGPGQGPLVGQDLPLVVGGETELGEEARALEPLPRGRLKTLPHHVERGLSVAAEHPVGGPPGDQVGDVAVVGSSLVGDVAHQLEADRVVRVAVVERRALLGRHGRGAARAA